MQESNTSSLENPKADLEDLYLLHKVLAERDVANAGRTSNGHVQAMMREHYGDNYEPDPEMPITLNSPTTTTTHHHHDGAKPGVKAGGVPWWVKAGLGAALLGTGAGGAMAVPWMMGAWNQVQEAAPEQERNTNTAGHQQQADEYFLRLGE